MSSKAPNQQPQRGPLPSIHLHPSLSTSSRHKHSSAGLPSPHAATSISSRPLIQELSPRPPSITTSSYRTTSRPSTASSLDEENSEDESVNQPHWTRRHHPYDRTRQHSRPHVSISPSNSRRASIYSPYARSNEDMGSLLRRGSASASASASADEGSHYGGDSPSASMSPLTTSSPVFTFVGQTRRDREMMMADGHLSAGMEMHTGGGGGQSVSSASASASAPLSLDSLPSYPPDQKPPFSYPVLIRLAILGSPQKRLLLSQIYSAIEEKFPWYRDSAPKAWKASVRHCLSLNKEFVRMQRAVEDPGVGCGGWWSVGEGMKGLKRPRKRRPAQSKRDHEVDQTPVIKAPAPSPLAIRRRHSTTFDDVHHTDPYPRYVSPYSSSSLPPSATTFKAESQTRSTLHQDTAMDVVLPPIEDYSLRLPPLQIPHPAQPLPTPPSSTRTAIFNGIGGEGTKGYSNSYSHPSYQVRRGSHTPTASSSSSYSTQSYGSASTSASSSSRPNPMSISSLLNGSRGSSGATVNGTVGSMLEDTFDKMDVDPEDVRSQIIREMPPQQQQPPQKKKDSETRTGKVTPFSSDQTLRPPSPEPPTSSASHHPRRSTTPVAPSGHRQRGQARASSRPPSHNTAPPRPTRPPPPLPGAEA